MATYCALHVATDDVEDDDATARELLRQSLGRAGWRSFEADNGRTALSTLEQQRPDLILLDLVMPEMDGFEFLEALRRRAEWRDIPVIVITAKDLSADERYQLSHGAQRVLAKGSTSRRSLVDLIRRHIDDRRSNRPGAA